MTYWPITKVLSADSPSIDAFARWRISSPTSLFDSVNNYDNGSLFWNTALTGAGDALFVANESSVNLTVSGGATDKSVRQTYEYFRYEPGKSHLVVMSCVIGAATAGVRKRVGYFDGENGVFFEQTGSGLSLILRSKASGVVTDTPFAQGSWNVDTLLGTGPSGITLVPTNANIFWIDIEWLGVGRVRAGIWGPDGVPIVCHEIQNANANTTVYMTTASLPMRYEIENTAPGNSGVIKQICSTVASEGGSDVGFPQYFGSPSLATTTITAPNRRAILSIRPKALFQGITNRIRIVPMNLSLLVTSNDCFWELVYDPTPSVAPSWTDVNTSYSSVEYATHGANGTAITGGITVMSGFAGSAQGSFAREIGAGIEFKYPLTLDMNGANPKSLSIVCTSLNNNSVIRAGLNWGENH